jgi:tetratricopeptide (TPR) repeat protein
VIWTLKRTIPRRHASSARRAWATVAATLAVCAGVQLSVPAVAADPAAAPIVSKSLGRPLRAAQDAIAQQHYDEALTDVTEARAMPVINSAYDTYVINAMLTQIYQGQNDTVHLVASMELACQSQYAPLEFKRIGYAYIAQYQYQRGDYQKAIDAAKLAIAYGAKDKDTAALVLRAEQLRLDTPTQRIWRRIWETEPRHRDSPLRYANISDNEVREIQDAVASRRPFDFVSIGGVVTGCPAEDGPGCTDQVWVELRRQGKNGGLLLSKVSNQWVIGLIQRWHLCNEDLEARRANFPSYDAYLAARDALVKAFPLCVKLPTAAPPA